MAERRMFAKTIIDSDHFLDMPLSAQALYFHLAMRADDDGFVGNPKKIKRTIGATDEDFDLLVSSRYLLIFESGVIVIRHWRLHNYIQADRYKETIYLTEKSSLSLDVQKAYELRENAGKSQSENECIQTVSKVYPQVSIELGKDSIGKSKDSLEREQESIGEDRKGFGETYEGERKQKQAQESTEKQEKAKKANAFRSDSRTDDSKTIESVVRFHEKFPSVELDVDNPEDLRRIDFNSLSERIAESKSLQRMPSLSLFLKYYDRIMAGYYKDPPPTE